MHRRPLAPRPGPRLLALAACLASAAALAACALPGDPGARLYRKHCAECHGVDGGGGILYVSDEGANLLDDAWVYGGDAANLERSLTDGLVFEHPSWEFDSDEIDLLVDQIFELRNESR